MKKTILVVDDEPDFLEMMRMRLESDGYGVITAENGEKALESIKNNKPDAVLLDILMPGMDGIDVLKAIRKHDKKLPVFILTAFSNEERFKLANRFNASGFIVKTRDLKTELGNVEAALNIAVGFKGKK